MAELYPGSNYDEIAAGLLQPADYRNPEPKARYHLVVIGAGPAGLITAIGAAGLGAKVALVEKHRMGGDCLNVGCVPSKALLAYTARHPQADFDDAFRWLRQVRADIAPHDSVARYTEAGVDVFLGAGELVDARCVGVSDLRLHTRRVAICTGASATLPPIPGLQDSDPLTNESIFDLTAAPSSLAILGGGPIGCELALVFARLGVEVHLFEMAPRILPLEIPAASAAVAQALQAAGVQLHTAAAVREIAASGGDARQVVTDAVRIEVSRVLVALGRQPNTAGLGLERAGVALTDRGFIRTDARLRTSRPGVFAAGDCATALQFTHHADAQARALVQNALFAPTARVSALVVPHCTYTDPEVASVGETPAVLAARGQAFDTYRCDFAELDRGRADPHGDGFAEVWTSPGSDRILGGTVVGHDAGEQIASLCLLMSQGLGLGAAGRTLFAYPTRAEYLKRLADAYNRSRLTPRVARVLRTWLDFTG